MESILSRGEMSYDVLSDTEGALCLHLVFCSAEWLLYKLLPTMLVCAEPEAGAWRQFH